MVPKAGLSRYLKKKQYLRSREYFRGAVYGMGSCSKFLCQLIASSAVGSMHSFFARPSRLPLREHDGFIKRQASFKSLKFHCHTTGKVSAVSVFNLLSRLSVFVGKRSTKVSIVKILSWTASYSFGGPRFKMRLDQPLKACAC